jgi:hypothetical protein
MTPKTRRTLARLKATAWAVLSETHDVPRRPIVVSASNNEVRVEVTLVSALDKAPAGGAAGSSPPPGVNGRFLSDLECAIVNVLLAGGCLPSEDGPALSGKQIAARLGREYNTQLKYVLTELNLRDVIDHTSNEGYRLAGAKPKSKESQA